MDCSNCVFNGGIVPGSSHHISCNGPKIVYQRLVAKNYEQGLNKNEIIFISVLNDVDALEQTNMIKINPHGKEKGWAFWPFNFDQIWIDKCGFKIEKEDDTTS